MSRSLTLSVAAASLLAASPVVLAFEGGDFILRAGAVHVAPDDSSDSITLGGNPLLAPLGVNDTQVTVDSNSQLGIRATYMVTDSLAVGVLGATPFKHNIMGGGDVSGDIKLGETRHLPPTITMQYFPLASSSAFQPFVGIGINYTTFFEEKTSADLDNTVAAAYPSLGIASSELELDDSVGVAVELGMDYMLSENFGLNAAIWWADINTDATVKVYDGAGAYLAETDEFEVEIDPMVYMVGFTYKF